MLGVHYFLAAAVVITAISGWIDVRTGEIPNRLTLPPLVAAPAVHFALPLLCGSTFDSALAAAGASVLGATACALLPMMLYRIGAMGGGDVKLFAAVGALVWPAVGLHAVLYTFCAAGVLAPLQMAYTGHLRRVAGNIAALVKNLFLPSHRRREIALDEASFVRFGPAIFLGTCLAVLVQGRLS